MANEPPSGPPLGFPNCPNCPYLKPGPPAVCLDCASKSFEVIEANACPTCSQMLDPGGSCPNWLCADSTRSIGTIQAIAYLSGQLRNRIHRYKYSGAWGWSIVFGRLLVAWLDRNGAANPPDLIVANPTYIPPGSDTVGHTERVIDAAAHEDLLEVWPFDINQPRAIIKTAPTEKSARNTATMKRATAAQIRSVLSIPNRSLVQGKRILVYDDVCTTGSQLDAVAECLIADGGAASVDGIVLARAPWRHDR
jgi:predicted amidophosphoribosyltransferase